MSTRGRELETAPDDGTSPPSVHDEIESPSGKLVYLYLAESDGATVEELKRALDMPTLRLYPILRTLADRDIVERAGGSYEVSA